MTMGWALNKHRTARQSPCKTTAPLMTRAVHQSSASECPVLLCQALHGVLHVICLIDFCMQSLSAADHIVVSYLCKAILWGKVLHVCFVAAP